MFKVDSLNSRDSKARLFKRISRAARAKQEELKERILCLKTTRPLVKASKETNCLTKECVLNQSLLIKKNRSKLMLLKIRLKKF